MSTQEVLDTATATDDGKELTAIQRRRLQDRKEWEAYWEIRRLDSDGTYFGKHVYLGQRWLFDKPITWFREKIVDPLHDKYRLPYYHRKFTRPPEIDMCGVQDHSCIQDANEQYRLDKMVDYYIIQILRNRLERCIMHEQNMGQFNSIYKCVDFIEAFEEAQLNNFIKYGEIGSEGDVVTAYMKQKHRMIWERRHPEVMAERERKYQEYREKKNNGHFDMAFWKKGLIFQDKKNFNPPHVYYPSGAGLAEEKPLSKDWEYYKKVAQDPEFDKEQGKTSRVRIFG